MPLGILAGGGELPRRLVAACAEIGRPCFVVAFEGHTDAETAAAAPSAWVGLGAAGRTLELLHEAGVGEIVFAGGMKRPSFRHLLRDADAKGASILLKLIPKALGDDGLLRALSRVLEDEGFRVVGVPQVLGTLVAPAGVWGRRAPDAAAEADIARGFEVAAALGALDIGQAVVVQQGMVLGVEAIEGTDALLQRVGGLRREGPGGVLVKRAKPGQDRRLDLPTIGSTTVAGAAAAGLRGIAVQAGACLVMGHAETVAAADAADLFLLGLGAS